MDAPDETSHMVVHSVIHTYAAAICYTNFVQSKLNTWPSPCAMCFHLSTWCASTCLRCWRTPSSPIMWPSIILLLTGTLTGPYICAGQTKWQTCAGELHSLHSWRYFYNFQDLKEPLVEHLSITHTCLFGFESIVRSLAFSHQVGTSLLAVGS